MLPEYSKELCKKILVRLGVDSEESNLHNSHSEKGFHPIEGRMFYLQGSSDRSSDAQLPLGEGKTSSL